MDVIGIYFSLLGAAFRCPSGGCLCEVCALEYSHIHFLSLSLCYRMCGAVYFPAQPYEMRILYFLSISEKKKKFIVVQWE
ncbi:hypothetical protein GDO81_015195 [Engystomops pustulosus]|uniref:Secreted protein n=1 Tax=Engystomops pustulosus TaxID=76066 RepID=A0AAV7ALR3_ENGPU|nr:hypothetical protein GDO81_015195 [Engystomops pustulosus]